MDLHWVVGYGSLMNTYSRSRTCESLAIHPVRLLGYERVWFQLTSGRASTMGIRRNTESSLAAALIQIDSDSLDPLDEREENYDRIALDKALLEMLEPGLDVPAEPIWTYYPRYFDPPTLELPVNQGYIDTCVLGAHEFGEEFAREFVEKTEFFSIPVRDNRENPGKSRPKLSAAEIALAERLLSYGKTQ